jgi:hypothetical protein
MAGDITTQPKLGRQAVSISSLCNLLCQGHGQTLTKENKTWAEFSTLAVATRPHSSLRAYQ